MSFVKKRSWVFLGVAALTYLAYVAVILGRAARDGDRRFEPDERDAGIHRSGEVIGYSAFSIGILGAPILTMAEIEHFWIGNAIYLSFVLAALIGTAVKLVAYRRGF